MSSDGKVTTVTGMDMFIAECVKKANESKLRLLNSHIFNRGPASEN